MIRLRIAQAGIRIGACIDPISATHYSARVAEATAGAALRLGARRTKENALNAATERGTPAAPAITVVMPVYNGAATLRQSLAPLLTMRAGGEIAEIIVVDDGSDDAGPAIARAASVTVLGSGGRLGPGGARNVGAASARGDVLWFVDADVVVHADGARVLAGALRSSDAAAVFGSYDDDPPAPNFFSQYKNLVHAYQHLQAGGDVDTFWAGCGAVTRTAFADAGGFDASKYPYSSIEDIELGWRLRRRGLRIHLEPALSAKHLKVWRLPNLLYTEIFRRALPWSRLMVAQRWWPRSLNMSLGERFRAALAICSLLTLLAAAAGLAPPWLAVASCAAAALANHRLFSYFRRRRGILFAMGGVLYHQVYYLYSAATLAYCFAAALLAPRGRAGERPGDI